MVQRAMTRRRSFPRYVLANANVAAARPDCVEAPVDKGGEWPLREEIESGAGGEGDGDAGGRDDCRAGNDGRMSVAVDGGPGVTTTWI
jgi:hypothetical protein